MAKHGKRIPAWKQLADRTRAHGAKTRLSEQSGIPLNVLSRILNGKRRPTLVTAVKLELATGIPAREFVVVD